MATPAPEPTPVAGSSIPTEHEQRQEQRAVESAQAPIISAVPRYVRGEEHVTAYIHPQSGETSFVAHSEPQSYAYEPSVPSNIQSDPPQSQYVQHEYHQQPTEPVNVPDEQPLAPPSPKPEVQTTFEPPKAEWDASK